MRDRLNTLELAWSALRGSLRCGAAALAALLLSGEVNAQATAYPPDRMSYQGFLVDADGDPLGNSNPANYPVTFRIWNHQQNAGPDNLLWSELQIVTVDKGQFNVMLGEGSPATGEETLHGPLATVFTGENASDRFISMTVKIGNVETTIAPRLRLLPSAYAFLAKNASALVSPNGQELATANNGELSVNGIVAANAFVGNGAGLTGVNASQLTSGTISSDRLPVPLSLGSSLNNSKIKLWDGGATSYGLGIQGGQFRLHVGGGGDRFSFLNGPAGTELVTIKGDGYMGVGTTAPEAQLHVVGNNFPQMRVASGAGAPYGSFLSIDARNNPGGNNFHIFSTAGQAGEGQGKLIFQKYQPAPGANIMTLTGNGGVGIGTVSPSHRLDVQGGNFNVSGEFYVDHGKPMFSQWYWWMGDNIYWNTGIGTGSWDCGVFGFYIGGNGDINEGGGGEIMKVRTVPDGGTWRIQADFRTHVTAENWAVQLLCINRRMINSY